MIAAVVGVGVWMVVDYVGRSTPKENGVATTATDRSPEPPDQETASPAPERPSPTPSRKPEKREPAKLITEGVTIQVLNGTNDPEAADAMAARLEKLGFTIAAVEATSTPYKETTVFWSFPDARDAARALAEKFGWVADAKPGNLADTVSLHVVVGRDET